MDNFKESENIRVRIAPSPTGYFHVGTAHTALFNYLFAKKMNGKFILRIEDTDLERSDIKFEKNIFDGMRWLGLVADESPEVGGPFVLYRQTERLDIYEKYLKQLLNQDLAYYCSCTKEELEAERQNQEKLDLAPKYSGKCRFKNAKSGGQVIRFKIPEEKVSFKDVIRGEITFDGSLIGDIAIAKDLRTPLYNFAVVVDDYEMKISHVIRGEDHIGNTPKQIFIQKSLGFNHPQYAHLPLILDEKRAKLSKRFAAVSIDDYRKAGFLPEAFINFMALLGWHPEDDKEVMSLETIIKEFSLERIQKAGAIFNKEKLLWINGQYIKNCDNAELLSRINSFYPELENSFNKFNLDQKNKLLSLAKERMHTLADFKEVSSIFFVIGEYASSLLVWKKSNKEAAKNNLLLLRNKFSALENELFIKSELEKILKQLGDEIGRGDIFWPLRVALSGQETSPGPVEIMEILGREESLARIKKAIEALK